MTSLRCEALTKTFGGVEALRQVSLTFPARTITAVVGPNGAGKTTLFNVLSGFLAADRGHVFYGDREIGHLPPPARVTLGLCRTFQENRVLGNATVIEQVMLARPGQRGENPLRALLRWGYGTAEAENRREAQAILARVGIVEHAEHPAAALSYGQQKLVALACAIATGARGLLVDEPLAGLHPDLKESVLDLLRVMREGGYAVVLTEHDLEAVRAVADQVVVMNRGRVIAVGAPRLVLEQADVVEAYLA